MRPLLFARTQQKPPKVLASILYAAIRVVAVPVLRSDYNNGILRDKKGQYVSEDHPRERVYYAGTETSWWDSSEIRK